MPNVNNMFTKCVNFAKLKILIRLHDHALKWNIFTHLLMRVSFWEYQHFMYTRWLLLSVKSITGEYIQHCRIPYKIQIRNWGYSMYVIIPCAFSINFNIDLISFGMGKASILSLIHI